MGNEVNPAIAMDVRLQRLKRKRARKKLLLKLLAAIAIVFILLRLIFGIAVVHGDSMEPSLYNNDIILFNRLFNKYKRNDIVLVKVKGENRYAVKRIIGTPGDVIKITKQGELYRNGEKVKTPGVYGKTYRKKNVLYPVWLSDDEYFVLGDHRSDSKDSRDFGVVKRSQLKGNIMSVLRWKT